MMDGRIALCVDELTCCNPELIGLDGESLESQAWLDVFVSAEEARNARCWSARPSCGSTMMRRSLSGAPCGRFVWNVRPNRRKRSTAPPWKRAVRRRRSEPRREAPCCRRPEQLFLRERSCKHACDRPSQLHPNREGS